MKALRAHEFWWKRKSEVGGPFGAKVTTLERQKLEMSERTDHTIQITPTRKSEASKKKEHQE